MRLIFPGYLTAALAAAAVLAPLAARADDKGMRGVPLLPAYQQECGSCHVAFAPPLLPASSWQRLMNDLPHHFGVDASLDPDTAQRLTRYLQAHASGKRARSAPPPEDRITRASWFVREHNEVASATWKSSAVKSAANCSACHPQADQGDFDEHRVRLPR